MYNLSFMQKKISHKKFPQISFFLSDKKPIADLEQSAVTYGGATKNLITLEQWSNVEKSEYITVNNKNNTLSLFVPDTSNIDNKDTNKQKEILKYVLSQLNKKYKNIDLHNALGTWYSNDLQKVVYDNIIIISINRKDVSINAINEFIQLAEHIKQEMKQEGVSIAINDSLAII